MGFAPKIFSNIFKKTLENLAKRTGEKVTQKATQRSTLLTAERIAKTTTSEDLEKFVSASVSQVRRTRPAGQIRTGGEIYNVFEEEGNRFIRQRDGSLTDVTDILNKPGAQIKNPQTGEMLPIEYMPDISEPVATFDKRIKTLLEMHKLDTEENLDVARSLVFRGSDTPESAVQKVMQINRGELPAPAIDPGLRAPLTPEELQQARTLLEPGEVEILERLDPLDARNILARAESPAGINPVHAEFEAIRRMTADDVPAMKAADDLDIQDTMQKIIQGMRPDILPPPAPGQRPANVFEEMADLARAKGLEVIPLSESEIGVHTAFPVMSGSIGVVESHRAGSNLAMKRFVNMEAAWSYIQNYRTDLNPSELKSGINEILEKLKAPLTSIRGHEQGFVMTPDEFGGMSDDILRNTIKEALDTSAEAAKNSAKYFSLQNSLRIGLQQPGDLFPREFAAPFEEADRGAHRMLADAMDLERVFDRAGIGNLQTLGGPVRAAQVAATFGHNRRRRAVVDTMAWYIADGIQHKWFKPKFLSQTGRRRQGAVPVKERVPFQLFEEGGTAALGKKETRRVRRVVRRKRYTPRFTRKEMIRKATAQKGTIQRQINRLRQMSSTPANQAKIKKLGDDLLATDLGMRSLRNVNDTQYRAIAEGIWYMRNLRAESVASKRSVIEMTRANKLWAVTQEGRRSNRKLFANRKAADRYVKKVQKDNPHLTDQDFLVHRPGKPTKAELAEEIGETLPAYITHLTPQQLANDYLSDVLPTITQHDQGEELSRVIQKVWLQHMRKDRIDAERVFDGVREIKEFEKRTDALKWMFEDFFTMIKGRGGTEEEGVKLANKQLQDLIAKLDIAVRSRAFDMDKAVIKVLPEKIRVPWYSSRHGGDAPLKSFTRSLRAYTAPVIRSTQYEPAINKAKPVLLQHAAFNDPMLRRAAMDWQNYLLGRFRPPPNKLGKALAWLIGRGYRSSLFMNLPIAAIQFTQPFMFLYPEVGGADFLAGLMMMRDKSFHAMARENRLIVETIPFGETAHLSKAFADSWQLATEGKLKAAGSALLDAGVTLNDFMAHAEQIIRRWAFASGMSKWMRLKGYIRPGQGGPLQATVDAAQNIGFNKGGLRGAASGFNPKHAFDVDFARIGTLTKAETDEMFAFSHDIVRRSMFLWSGIDRPAYLRALETAGEQVGFPLFKPGLMFANFPTNYANRLFAWSKEATTPGLKSAGLAKLTKFAGVIFFLGGPGAFPVIDKLMREKDPEAANTFTKVTKHLDKYFTLSGLTGMNVNLTRAVGMQNITDLISRFGVPGRFAEAMGGRANIVYGGLVDVLNAFNIIPGVKEDVRARSRGEVFGTLPAELRDWATKNGWAFPDPERKLQAPLVENIPPVFIDYMTGGVWGERLLRYIHSSMLHDERLNQVVAGTKDILPQTGKEGLSKFIPWQEGQFSLDPLREPVAIRNAQGNLQEVMTTGEMMLDLTVGPPKGRELTSSRRDFIERQRVSRQTIKDNLVSSINRSDWVRANAIVENADPTLAGELAEMLFDHYESLSDTPLAKRQIQLNEDLRLRLMRRETAIIRSKYASRADRARAQLRLVALARGMAKAD